MADSGGRGGSTNLLLMTGHFTGPLFFMIMLDMSIGY